MEEQPGPVLDLEEEIPTVLGTARATQASGQKTGPATGPVLKGDLKLVEVVGGGTAQFLVHFNERLESFRFQPPPPSTQGALVGI
jgi:hypothetical protein